MSLSRQQTFQELRPVCVELSAVALRFKGQQATVKQVFSALQDVQGVLDRPQVQASLDEKLAEYAFFPLTHIFNQAQALSSTCVEAAIRCVIVLVSKGWQANIAVAMGKQLLILMTLLSGGQAKAGGNEPTDEIKALAFSCIKVVIEALAQKDDGAQLLNDAGSKNITDQLVYLLLESVTDSPSDQVQVSAAEALSAIVSSISSRVVLASLLPRTASSLTQALRTSTKARRTRKVLSSYLILLKALLEGVLADSVVYPLPSSQSDQASQDDETASLDESWLRATTEQVKLALIQVVKLRSHDHLHVRSALADLCFMIIEECPRSLPGSLPVAVDTLIYLAHLDDAQATKGKLEFLATAQPAVAEVVREKLYDWCQALPRTMQGSEDRPKEHLFGQISAALSILTHNTQFSDEAISRLVAGLVEGLTVARREASGPRLLSEQPHVPILSSTELQEVGSSQQFKPILLERSNESASAHQLHLLLSNVAEQGYADRLTRMCLVRCTDAEPQDRLLSAWLALQCLSREETRAFDLSSFISTDEGNDMQLSRPQLVSDLYAATLPWLVEDGQQDPSNDWRLMAVAIECTVLQATQLDISYRPELLDTLYPMLSLLGSGNVQLREHAMTGLNLLATACKYSSTSDMLVDNADYLINSVGMKLNAFDVTPQAPQVLLMMVRLCGARIVPQLDDLISSMFSALDNFHGYPRLVDGLFQVLRAIIDESKKQPQLTITGGMTAPDHHRRAQAASSLADILEDLNQRKARKAKPDEEDAENIDSVPRRPWKDAQADGPTEDGSGSDNESSQPGQNGNLTEKEEHSKLSQSYRLLLSIAQATSPHLTSPAPEVRQTLLQLLDEVAPLLAQDEKSFLPLINNVWPVIVPRLLAYSAGSDTNDSETAYNAVAAADVISALCRGAGDFMSSRIEDILPQVKKLFVEVRSAGKTGPQKEATNALSITSLAQAGGRSPRSQVLAALIRLLATIISYVRLSDDAGEQIFEMLVPFSSAGQGQARQALTAYNADALWLWDQRHGLGPGPANNQ